MVFQAGGAGGAGGSAPRGLALSQRRLLASILTCLRQLPGYAMICDLTGWFAGLALWAYRSALSVAAGNLLEALPFRAARRA